MFGKFLHKLNNKSNFELIVNLNDPTLYERTEI